MRVRRAAGADAPALRALYGELLPGGRLRSESSLRALLEAPPAGMAILVAEEAGALLGTAQACALPDAAETGFLVLENVCVRACAQGRGVGRALLAAAEAFGQAQGCGYALLVSSGFRKGAHAFYAAMGYTEDVRGFRKRIEER